tara:strand:+ start:813 stop:1028 length:216 start_codon:yes stop_codon:yes gene_type:complete
MKIHEVRLKDIKERDDGTLDLEVEMTSQFREWFMRKENLEVWNEELFQERLLEAIKRDLGDDFAEETPGEE